MWHLLHDQRQSAGIHNSLYWTMFTFFIFHNSFLLTLILKPLLCCVKNIWSISCRQPRIFLDCKLGRQQSSPHQLGGHRRLSSHWLGLLRSSQVASSDWLNFSFVPVHFSIFHKFDLFSKSFVLWRHMTKVLSTEYTECQAFCQAVQKIGFPPPPHPQASVAPPPSDTRGDFWACGGWGEGSQFGRRYSM